MPQITSCPECGKKLRVPDELIGKKVKCPGCAMMFVAEADEQDEPVPPPKKAPAKAAPERPRSDAVTSSPRGKNREADEEAPRSRGRDRDEKNDEDDPRPRRGRDRDEENDEDDRRRRRGRDRDEDEEDDRPSRKRRDEEDEDEDRPARRRGNEGRSSRRDRAQGWQKVRTGTNFVLISGWLNLTLVVIAIVFTLVMALFIGASGVPTRGFGGGFPAGGGASGAMGVLSCGFTLVVGLLGLTAFVLLMVGTGFCMGTPQIRGQSMRGMAMTAFYLFIGAIGAYIFGIVATILFAPLGMLIVVAAGLAFFAGHVLWMLYLRMVCLYFKDPGLGSAVLTNLIAQIVTPVVGAIIFVLMGLVLRSAGGAGAIISMILTLLFYVVMLGIYIWYLMTLKNVRDLVDR